MSLRGAALWVLACLCSGCGRVSEGQEGGRVDPELESRVEQLLPQVSQLSGLPLEWVPDARRASGEILEAYLLERLHTEYPGDSLTYLTLAYQAFGLLPDGVDLGELLVNLMLEQAIGFYDPVRNTFFVREQVPSMALDAVLVHELTHALQDQQEDLDSLIRGNASNDGRSAAQAAIEGHATVTMLAFQMAQATGADVEIDQLPELGPEMAAMLANPTTMPQLASAPAIVREPLLFAYLGGARYVQRLWRSNPDRPPPLGRWLPESTEQLLHTERLLEEPDPPSTLHIEQPGEDWSVLWAHDLGELEIRIYFQEHLGVGPSAEGAAEGWDADAYVLLSKGEDLILVWYTAWDSDIDAEEFASAYRRSFAARHGVTVPGGELSAGDREARLDRLTLSGRAVVRVVEGPADLEMTAVPAARLDAR